MVSTKKKFDKLIERIAKEHCCVETLKTRNDDFLDVYEIPVSRLKAALEQAYWYGQESGMSLGRIGND